MGRAVKQSFPMTGHRMANATAVTSSCAFLKLIVNDVLNALRWTTFENIW